MAASPQHRVSTGERLNTAETTGRLQQTLGAKGIRLTRQRRVILQVMDDAEQHLDVDQILERAQEGRSGRASGNRISHDRSAEKARTDR